MLVTLDTNMGKYTSLTPSFLISALKNSRIFSQMQKDHGQFKNKTIVKVPQKMTQVIVISDSDSSLKCQDVSSTDEEEMDRLIDATRKELQTTTS
ncbi:unnamed protein product [Leptidea sinapis]|uniref:Uncharacterized protein n=1 Tax=Leptidea sinapis TaxID=189913 RepID=A0A5E4PR46_9NEOP|nr:unnamed protein product [Leptidea sinapis]